MLNALTSVAFGSALARRITKLTARSLADRAITAPFVAALRRCIHDIEGRPAQAGESRPALLALQPIRFRGELELCDSNSPYRILILPFDWQMRLLMLFYPKHVSRELVFRTDAPAEIVAAQSELRRFLKVLIADLYPQMNIVGTLSAGAHYWRDLDWGVAGRMAHYPFIVLHRENLYPREAHREILYKRFGFWKPFEGDALITHNTITRTAILKTGFCRPDQVHALGAMRMDGFIRRLKAEREAPRRRERPLVVLFSFVEGVGMTHRMELWSEGGSDGWARLFDAIHSAMVLLARKRPDIDVVVKFKTDSYVEQRFAMALERAGLPADLPDNLQTTQSMDAQDLIVDSSVVVGFGSTVLLEAAIAGKPVILPLLEEAAEPEFEPFAHFADRPELFDVAGSREEIIAQVERRLDDPAIAPDCMQAREQAFEDFVSSIDPRAVERYVAFLTEAVEGKRAA